MELGISGRTAAVAAASSGLGLASAAALARAGATAFLKTLATEVARDGVTVNSAQPGLHATNRLLSLHGDAADNVAKGIPAGFVGDPADFGALVAFLCSEHAKYITGAAI